MDTTPWQDCQRSELLMLTIQLRMSLQGLGQTNVSLHFCGMDSVTEKEAKSGISLILKQFYLY